MAKFKIEINLKSEAEKEAFKNMAEECGFSALSEYARASMFMYYNLKDSLKSLLALELMLKNMNTGLVADQKDISEKISRIERIYRDSEVWDLLQEVQDILQGHYPKGVKVSDLILRIGEEKKDLLYFVMETKYFDAYYNVDKGLVTLRDIPTISGMENDKMGRF